MSNLNLFKSHLIAKVFAISFVVNISCKTLSPDQQKSSTSSIENNDSDMEILFDIEKRFRFLPNNSKALLKEMGPTGSYRYNRNCDNVKSSSNSDCKYYIEEQRKGFIILYAGLYHNNPELIEGGLQIIKWGFSRQDKKGGFSKSVEPFHSSSFFIDAAAHSLLILEKMSPARADKSDIRSLAKKLVKALGWFVSDPLWSNGLQYNYAMAHRHFVVASAIGLTLKVAERYEIEISDNLKHSANEKMNTQLSNAIKRLKSNGVMPELGGYDSSYQMAGVLWGSYWLSYYGNHPRNAKVSQTLRSMADWELTRISADGTVNAQGNKRTAGQETGRTGVSKKVDYKMVIKSLYYMANLTNTIKYKEAADKVASKYYNK